MGGDSEKNIGWNEVDGNKGDLPLPDIRQCHRSNLVELRNTVDGEAAGGVNEVCR